MIDLATLAIVFGVIFAAELPDKTARATAALASRQPPFAVLLGAVLALIAQSFLAVLAGGLLAAFPERAVEVGAGLVFVVAGVVLWQRTAAAGWPTALPTDRLSFGRALATSFVVVFVDELGDLTQIGTAALAAHFGDTLTVFVGSASALVAVSILAVAFGDRFAAIVRRRATARAAAILVAVVGVALLSGLL